MKFLSIFTLLAVLIAAGPVYAEFGNNASRGYGASAGSVRGGGDMGRDRYDRFQPMRGSIWGDIRNWGQRWFESAPEGAHSTYVDPSGNSHNLGGGRPNGCERGC